MNDREAQAVRDLVSIVRSEPSTGLKILKSMKGRGYTVEETQAAANAIHAAVEKGMTNGTHEG